MGFIPDRSISVIQKLVPSIQINQDIIGARLNQMNDTMGPLRDQGWRNEVRTFFSDPRPNVRTSPGSPRLWDEAEARASDQYDVVGNAAMLEASILRHLQNQDLGVNDITNKRYEDQPGFPLPGRTFFIGTTIKFWD